MGRWAALTAGAAWLVVVAVWLFTGSPRGAGAGVQAQLWGGRMPQRGMLLHPGADRMCVIEQVDPRHASTASCLSCHDGTVGPGFFLRRGPHDPGTGHPVDVDYDAAYARAPDKLMPTSMLPHDVPLVDGKVACTSCHDPASTARNHVARPASLCSACHNQ